MCYCVTQVAELVLLCYTGSQACVTVLSLSVWQYVTYEGTHVLLPEELIERLALLARRNVLFREMACEEGCVVEG